MPEPEPLESTSGDVRRDVWFGPGPRDGEVGLALFLDAELYLRNVDALPLIEAATVEGKLPPTAFLFVSHLDAAARHRDYLCDEAYARFIAQDAVSWVAERQPNLRESGHTICGLSLSGLAAAHAAFRYPGIFSRALCQSGSFWWLADHPVELPRTTGRFWMSVGDEETARNATHPPSGLHQRVSQIQGVELAVDRFAELGATVRYEPYAGGHSAERWRRELLPALEWLLGDDRSTGA